MLSNYNREILPEEESWANRPLEYWGIDLDAFEPRYENRFVRSSPVANKMHLYRAKRLLSLVQVVSSRVLVHRPCLDDLVCDNSRIVLVGDAAHPILVS